ncbi:hypothetical protein JYT74_01030 [Crocinitomix catalasitica]|nr:hypothetical protein [Crocinitomix catalasitica]
MKRLILILVTVSTTVSLAQNEFIAYPATGKGVASTFVTDYHCLGINPANLGWKSYEDKKITTGSSEFGISMYSASLSKQDLRESIWGVIRSGSLDSLSDAEKLQAAQGFADDFSFNFDYGMFGFAFQHEKFGGIAFSMRSRATWSSGLSDDMSKMLFQGAEFDYFDQYNYWNGVDTVQIPKDTILTPAEAQNILGGHASIPLRISDILGDTYLRLSMTREYHIGYGRQLLNVDSVFTLYAGVGAKYIEGIAMMDMGLNDDGSFELFSAFSPSFDLNYSPAAIASNPSAVAGDPSNFWRKNVGSGFGLDFGVNAELFNILHIAASVTNIGSMTWDGNVYTAGDSLVIDYYQDGLDDMNIANAVPEMLEESGLLQISGQEEYKMTLPGTLRFGASIELGKLAEIGAEMIAPFNDVPGSVNGFAWGLGGDVKLVGGKIILMLGLTGGGGYDYQLPMGVNFVLGEGSYEFGIASRDAVTFFTQNKPTISAAFGFARFRF